MKSGKMLYSCKMNGIAAREGLSCFNSSARDIGKESLRIMIKIITKTDRTYDYNFDDCENFFRAKIFSTSFTDVDLSVLQEIDHAELLDRHTGAIKTDFGITSIDYLSTGCKTVLTYLYILRNANNYDGSILLNVTECGANALRKLFSLMDQENDLDITLLLRHTNNLFLCGEHDFLYDGKRMKTLF